MPVACSCATSEAKGRNCSLSFGSPCPASSRRTASGFFTLQNLQSSVANMRCDDCRVGSWIGVTLLILKLLKLKERKLPQGADVLFESIRLRHHVRKFRPRPSTMYHIEVAEKSRERHV